MSNLQIVYRRPTHTGDGYGIEAVYCPGTYELVGYGSGNSPEEARKAAYRNLMATIDNPPAPR
jgi:hypothetical protein